MLGRLCSGLSADLRHGIRALRATPAFAAGAIVTIALAVGARRVDIARLIVGDGFRFVLVGLVLGTAVAAAATRLLSALLLGVTASDAVTYSQVIVVVAAVSAIACAVPAVVWGPVAKRTRILR